ncbi:hypothetical protein H9P43_002686 [Blastocladiella emersonii ATCC 22665]|nr:hypothetical protein H9P43_002686 [Blastocladiella emersonii ATCC 22665]
MNMSASPVIIVTGASRGYGAAIVRELFAIHPAARVVGTARAEPELAALQKEVGGEDRFRYVAGDITDAATAQKVVDAAVAAWGRIDAVVQNAGVIEPMGAVSTIALSAVRTAFEVNVFSVLQLAQLALPHLRASHGRQIIVSSGAATKAYDGWAAYCSTKAAVNMLAASFGAEEPAVTTIALRPGVLDTPMQEHIRATGEGKLAAHAWFVGAHKDGKLVPPEVSGHVAAQLALHAPKEWSGEFIDWEDDKVAKFQHPSKGKSA